MAGGLAGAHAGVVSSRGIDAGLAAPPQHLALCGRGFCRADRAAAATGTALDRDRAVPVQPPRLSAPAGRRAHTAASGHLVYGEWALSLSVCVCVCVAICLSVSLL